MPNEYRITIKQDGYRCLRCGHEWVPRRKTIPVVCPSCRSAYWRRPRESSKEDETADTDTSP